jgi:hypothetical protein
VSLLNYTPLWADVKSHSENFYPIQILFTPTNPWVDMGTEVPGDDLPTTIEAEAIVWTTPKVAHVGDPVCSTVFQALQHWPPEDLDLVALSQLAGSVFDRAVN